MHRRTLPAFQGVIHVRPSDLRRRAARRARALLRRHAPAARRFTKKLAAWRQRNGVGRLTRKQPARERPTYTAPPCFTLLEGDFAAADVIIVTVTRTFPLYSDLSFAIVEHPPIGAVRVLQDIGDDAALLHLADSREAAELWLAGNGYSRARIEEVSADEAAADVIEARRAA